MIAASESALELAIRRLHWCLDQPLLCGGLEWGARVSRALERLEEAFERHVSILYGRDGPLARIVNPDLLPFTPESRRVTSLRLKLAALRSQIHVLRVQFLDAVLLFPSPWEAAEPPDGLAEARAFRLFGVLGSCASDVLDRLEKHRTCENFLLRDTEHPPVVGS